MAHAQPPNDSCVINPSNNLLGGNQYTMTIDSICGYKLDSNAEEEIKKILLWAPIDIDYNRFHPKHGKTIARKYGYKGDRIKRFCKKLIQDWQNQYDKAVEVIKEGGIVPCNHFTPTHEWITIVTPMECELILSTIQEFQTINGVADGYFAKHIKDGNYSIYIWYDI